jgi:hypothetical protein
MEGFACLVFADEDEVNWMVGLDENDGKCECWMERKEGKRHD